VPILHFSGLGVYLFVLNYLFYLYAESSVFQFAIQNIKTTIHRKVLLPVVLYGCKTWSLTLREECGLTLFENRVLRKISGPKRDEVAGKWRRLYNEGLYDLYSSANIIRVIESRMRWAAYVT
jgi:hypothetical protein